MDVKDAGRSRQPARVRWYYRLALKLFAQPWSWAAWAIVVAGAITGVVADNVGWLDRPIAALATPQTVVLVTAVWLLVEKAYIGTDAGTQRAAFKEVFDLVSALVAAAAVGLLVSRYARRELESLPVRTQTPLYVVIVVLVAVVLLVLFVAGAKRREYLARRSTSMDLRIGLLTTRTPSGGWQIAMCSAGQALIKTDVCPSRGEAEAEAERIIQQCVDEVLLGQALRSGSDTGAPRSMLRGPGSHSGRRPAQQGVCPPPQD